MYVPFIPRLVAIALALVLAGCVGCGGGEADGTSETSGLTAWLVADTDTRDGLVLRSDDGAKTWSVALRTPERFLGAIAFADHERGSVVGSDVFRTIDGGASWNETTLPLGPPPAFSDVAFAGERGVLVGNVLLPPKVFSQSFAWYTQDGGATWNPSKGAGVGSASSLLSSCLLANGTALAVGAGGFNSVSSVSFALASEDAGKTWSEISPRLRDDGIAFLGGALQSVTCTEPDTLWIVGQDVCAPFCGQDEGEPVLLFRSSNGGLSWDDLSARAQHAVGPENAALSAVSFVDGAHGWAVGFRGDIDQPHPLVLRTTDRGASWTRQSLPNDPPGALTGVAFADARTGITIGSESDRGPLAFATTDGGLSWRPLPLPVEVTSLRDVTFEPRF